MKPVFQVSYQNDVFKEYPRHKKPIQLVTFKAKLVYYEGTLFSFETFANGGQVQIHAVVTSIETEHIDYLCV